MAYVTDKNNNLIKIKEDGFLKSSFAASVMQLKANYDVKFAMNMDENVIKDNLIKMLIDEAVKQNIISVHSEQDHLNYSIKYQAELNVVKPGVRFQNVQNDNFIVHGEQFTEADLIKAVKIAYPERFI